MRAKHDEEAYICMVRGHTERHIPESSHCCTMSTSDVENKLAKSLCSSLHRVAETRAETCGGLEFIVVNSFHPSTFAEQKLATWSGGSVVYEKAESAIEMRRKLLGIAFRLSFLVAMKALVGRKVVGLGVADGQESVRHNGPIPRFGERQGEMYKPTKKGSYMTDRTGADRDCREISNPSQPGP